MGAPHRILALWLAGISFILLVSAARPAQSQSARRPPQAQSDQEFRDYQADYALSGGVAVETAAREFAFKYPSSDLRAYLYSKAMREYQNENNPAKMLAMGEKVLTLDRDNPIALTMTAVVLANNLKDSDADRAQKVLEIERNANRALETMETEYVPPAKATPELIEANKKALEAMAHAALGIMDLKTANDAGAVIHLKAASELGKAKPDPYAWYYLALAQDHLATSATDPGQKQRMYTDALASVSRALDYGLGNPKLQQLGKVERDRLQKLLGTPQ